MVPPRDRTSRGRHYTERAGARDPRRIGLQYGAALAGADSADLAAARHAGHVEMLA
ncbi:MAG TPA: hypothetical protein VND80_10210 [Steroidobacteraceae bacterium]|nr:hypothetical protein [Steroidobacteraceae bacterium]